MSRRAQDAIRVAAVDLGASSGRVVIGHGTAGGFALREIHRFANQPRTAGGVLRWDAAALFGGILAGLRAAGREYARLDAVAVDGWGVDYGLLDGDGGLTADPANYRDPRTGPSYAAVIETAGGLGGVDAARLYEATGIAAHPFNTVFQLMADGACGLPVVAGPTEAASWGNVLVQARALGVTGGSLPELRSLVRRGTRLTCYRPAEQEAGWERADEIVLASRS